MIAWFTLGIALLTVLVSAHAGSPPADMGASLLVLPVPGCPISFEQVEERSYTVGDATSSAALRSNVYRDSFGRVRLDGQISSPDSGSVIQIIDPVAGSRVILISTEDQKVGYRVPLPQGSGLRFANFSLAGDEAAASRNWISRTENLGTLTITGIKFEGTLIVQVTEDDEPRLTKTVEQWHSAELNLIGKVAASLPNGSYTARIQKVRREEPDSGLFRIPPGYVILDLPPLAGEP